MKIEVSSNKKRGLDYWAKYHLAKEVEEKLNDIVKVLKDIKTVSPKLYNGIIKEIETKGQKHP